MIDTRRLRTLRAVADHGTVTAAAAALHLTPSAVSQQLVALEHEVGHRLFARDGRGVRLTAVGKIMLGHTNEVLAQLERAEAEVAAYSSGAAGEVTVACFATAISAVLSPAITLAARHRSRPSGTGTRRRGRPEPDHAARRRGRRRDRGRIPGRAPTPPTAACPACRCTPSRSTWSCPKATPWPPPRCRPSASKTWIGPYPGNPVHDVIAFACEQAGFTPRFAHCSDDFRAVVALVGAGAGVALVPRLGAARHGPVRRDGSDVTMSSVTAPGVTVHHVPGPERRVFAAVRRGAESHPLLRPLLDTLREIAGSLGTSDTSGRTGETIRDGYARAIPMTSANRS